MRWSGFFWSSFNCASIKLLTSKASVFVSAENLLIIHDAALATKYAANWAQHAMHSTVCKGKAKCAEVALRGGNPAVKLGHCHQMNEN